MRRTHLIWITLLFLAATDSRAQSSPYLLEKQAAAEFRAELERQLENASAEARPALLVELAAAWAEVDPPRAVAHGEEARRLLDAASTPDPALNLRLLLAIGRAHDELGDKAVALAEARSAVEMARRQENPRPLARAFDLLADVYRHRGDYEPSLAASERAISLLGELNDLDALGDALNDAGIVQRRLGRLSEAMAYYLRSIELEERAGNEAGMARTMTNLGVLYRQIGDLDRALELYRKALDIRLREGRLEATARLLNNLGILHRIRGEPERAIEQYERSLEIKQRLDDRTGIATTLGNLGEAYENLGEQDKAIELHRRALALREELGDRAAAGTQMVRLAGSVREESPRQALELAERAAEIAEEINLRSVLQDAYALLADLYEEAGRPRDALRALRSYDAVRSSLLAEKGQRELAALESSYARDKQAREIELLKQAQAFGALELAQSESAGRALTVTIFLLLAILGLLFHRSRLRAHARTETLLRREREIYIAELERKNAEILARNDEMARFTYTVSHDLKSPLVTIRGFLGLLERDAREGKLDKLGDSVARIQNASGTMARLLDELLELSRIGRVAEPSEPVPLAEVAEQATELLAGTINERGARIEIAADLPTVLGDRRRLLEVFQNLIENAVKYSDAETPRVEIGHRPPSGVPGDEQPVVFVQDNGPGIAPAYQEKVFGLFERLDTSRDGTGIGLAIVRRIVEVHGGRIWVESDGIDGSTFCLALPSIRPSESAPTTPA